MEESDFITLKLVGFNEIERKNLMAILVLATRALKKKWQLVDTDSADFFLFSVEMSAGIANAEINAVPAQQCLFCTLKTTTQTDRTLLVDEKRLPLLSELVELFNRVSVKQLDLTAASQQPVTTTFSPIVTQAVEAEPFFDAQQGILKYLLVAEEGQFLISLADQVDFPALYIDREKNTYYSQNKLAQLDPYILSLSTALIIKPCSKIVFKNYIEQEGLKAQSLKDLIWYAAIKTSAGRVIKGHANTDVVTLIGWPELRLAKYLDYARLAAFMKNNAATLELIAEHTKTSLAEVNNFYNACYLIGLIEKREQIDVNKKNVTPAQLEILARIDARLK